MDLPVIVIGGGGHAKVLISTLLLSDRKILGFIDPDLSLPPLLGVANIGNDDMVLRHAADHVLLVNGVGSVDTSGRRRRVYERFCEKGYVFETVVHPSAIVAREVHVDPGVQIMAAAVVQPGNCLGANIIINTGARVDHDCLIGAHAHVAPGATLSGHVRVGEGAHVGTGASVIQGITIGAGSIVGAGAVVICDVPPGITVVGVPAKPVALRSAVR